MAVAGDCCNASGGNACDTCLHSHLCFHCIELQLERTAVRAETVPSTGLNPEATRTRRQGNTITFLIHTVNKIATETRYIFESTDS